MELEEKDIITEEHLNLENLIKKRNPGLFKLLPKFVLAYFKRILHIKELNSVMYRNRDKFGMDFVDIFFEEFQAKINVINEENIPKTGKYIIASNHPLGGLDGLALMSVVGKVRKDIVFPVNDLLMNLPNLRQVFIPINKHGSNINNINTFHETFASDSLVLYFPAGICSRKRAGRIVDSEWKKSFITKAKQYQRDIIPVHIEGRNSNFFYNLSNLRKFFGVKANIEMIYLVDEVYKQKNKNINITFGKPISYNIFDKTLKDKEWADKLKTHVYELGRDNQIQFRI